MTRRVLALLAMGVLALLAGCASTPRGIPIVGLGVLASPTPTVASTPAATMTPTPPHASTPRKCIVNTDAVDGGASGGMANIRACPSVHCAVVRVVAEGVVLRVLGERDGWLRVRDGWIWKPLCK